MRARWPSASSTLPRNARRTANRRGARLARLRLPARPVGLLAEARARDQRAAQILRILDDARHRDPFLAEIRMSVEVLRERRLLAVRNAVPAEVARPEAGRDDLERAA